MVSPDEMYAPAPTGLTFGSCQGFGGAFDLAAHQAGFEMRGRVELVGGYGALNILANRHILGSGWDTQISDDKTGYDWDPMPVQLLVSNPPCSGFSTMSNKNFRGMDSKINDCMWALQRYAARVKPEVVIFESVQQAFTQGRPLMQALRAALEDESGEKYDLHHVLHNNYSVGGCSIRRRYFFVASRVPFGVEPVELQGLPILDDVLRDLEPLDMTWEKQPYRGVATWWSAQMHDGTGMVDGHATMSSPWLDRIMELVDGTGIEWAQGESVSTIARRYYQKYDRLPKSWYYDSYVTRRDEDGRALKDANGKEIRDVVPRAEIYIKTDFNMGFNQLTRWKADKPARVITGSGGMGVLHPHLMRTLTHREAARIQGFPDLWRARPMRGVAQLNSTWGKGTPTHASRWISHWAGQSILGKPGTSPRQTAIGDREFMVDYTNDWKKYAVKTEYAPR